MAGCPVYRSDMSTILGPLSGTQAKLKFLDGDYEVIAHGDVVLCAVTGQAIPLGDLRYWSVDRQEAYADSEAAHTAYESATRNGEAF